MSILLNQTHRILVKNLKFSFAISSSNNQLIRNMADATPSKLTKLTPYIGTHDKTFHCDDVTACYMLKQLPRFKDHDIVRTRDQETLDKAEIVVDVGSVFDIEKLRLDHHQRTFQKTIHDFYPKLKTTNPKSPPRLSSAGLVYVVFGHEFIMTKLGYDQKYEELEGEEKKKIDAIYEKAYIEFMEEVDAIDNGVEIASGDNITYNYHINSGIANRVGRLNPIQTEASDEMRLKQFYKAMELVGSELEEGIKFLGSVWWPKRQQFREFVIKRKEFDPSGQIVHLASDHMLGWKSAIYDLEEELGIVGDIKFIIYCDNSGESPWRVLAVPVGLKSFASRIPLKEEWRGHRGEELQAICGIPDASFVHMSGFTGGAKSLDGVKSMVRKTLGLEA